MHNVQQQLNNMIAVMSPTPASWGKPTFLNNQLQHPGTQHKETKAQSTITVVLFESSGVSLFSEYTKYMQLLRTAGLSIRSDTVVLFESTGVSLFSEYEIQLLRSNGLIIRSVLLITVVWSEKGINCFEM